MALLDSREQERRLVAVEEVHYPACNLVDPTQAKVIAMQFRASGASQAGFVDCTGQRIKVVGCKQSTSPEIGLIPVEQIQA
jgi:hypothetical protein